MNKSKYVWENDETHSGYAYNGSVWKKSQVDFLFKFIDEKFKFKTTGSKCLDIGCNSAFNLMTFKNCYPNKNNEYYGFDLNNTALSIAKENVPEGKFKKCNFLLENPLLSFEDNFFDICFSTWVLSHLNTTNYRENLIKEMVRVSKRGIIYEAWDDHFCKNFENLPCLSSKSDEKEFNVVVFDDYTAYSKFINFEKVVTKDKSALFYWDKTNEKKN